MLLVMGALSGCVANTPVNNTIKISYVSDPDGLEIDNEKLVVSAMDEIGEYFDFEKAVYDVKEISEAKNAAQKAMTEGADLYIGTSYAVNNELLRAFDARSESLLAIIGNRMENEKENVVSITFKMEEAAFLAGYLAAGVSETGVVAYIGGYDSDYTESYFGFYSGAKYKDPLITVESFYTDSYNNSVKGRAAAEEVTGKNADVIYSNCGSCALGITEYVAGTDVKVILSEQYGVKSDTVIAQAKIYMKNAALYVIDEYLNEQLKEGSYRYGISYGFVDLQVENAVSSSIRDDVGEIKTLIRTSKIKVPSTKEETDMFLGGNVTLQK